MPALPPEVAEARVHLEAFERDMPGEAAFDHLAEGLALLAEVRNAGDDAKSASNLVSTYAKKALAKLESLLASEHTIHYEVFNDWGDLFSEFQHAGFTAPAEVPGALQRLADKTITGKLSPAEQKEIRERLQAMGARR